jgi:hypothetical protein
MQVDHVVPECLLAEPPKLAAVLCALGLPSNFRINSFANWLPACGPCNGTKSDMVFVPSPIVQVLLQRTASKAANAERLAAKTVSERKIANALNVLEQAHDNGELDAEIIQTLVAFISVNRESDLAGQPIRLSPLYETLSEQNGLQIVRGPYGIGGRPTARGAQSSFSCPNCGSIAAWNGARCVICGAMNDE